MFFRPGSWLAHLQQRLPSECAICGRWPGQRVCADCLARWAARTPRCRRCALPLAGGALECGACLRTAPAFDGAWAGVEYGYPWTLLLTQFKFQQDPGAAQALAQLLGRVPGVADALQSARWIVPVPLSPARLRERGFNQAALLARALARLQPAPCAVGLLLERIHHAPAQSGLQRAQRLRNLRGAFAVPGAQAARLAGQRVVLVDDIMTTGATLDAAAQALRRAGAAHICAMVVARTGRLP
ncbi:ComF family protein [Comamonas antarctica]|uniref:ComF family protein n=3 Tax=Comamonas antarctica TaxID=2743470 RepID=A0A6N1WYA8_9BURK|nr:ComF family protein [Comamonas antarctica]QKV52051.1 ComF family protein [Comamonas antarctica]